MEPNEQDQERLSEATSGEAKMSRRGESGPDREHFAVANWYAVWIGCPTQKDQCLLQTQTQSPPCELKQAMPGAQ